MDMFTSINKNRNDEMYQRIRRNLIWVKTNEQLNFKSLTRHLRMRNYMLTKIIWNLYLD